MRSLDTSERRRFAGRAIALALICSAGGLGAPAAAQVRTMDGSNNNLANPTMGQTDTNLHRMMPSAYADGVSAMAGASRPNARDISNAVSAQTAPLGNTMNLTSMFWQWGQFLDHDLDLTGGGTESANIAVNDPFDPLGPSIHFTRSTFDPTTGTGVGNPRQQPNQITHWMDASNVYGSSDSRALALRANDGTGRMLVDANNMLPVNDATIGVDMANDGQFPDNTLRAAGDVRANEVAGLTGLHTVFVREHNRLADEISAANPGMTGDQVYQKARSLVGAQMQKITYEDWLPSLLGSQSLDAYAGYNDTVNSNIANEFSTAAFRVGHTMLNQNYLMQQQNGQTAAGGDLSLAAAFFDPTVLTDDNLADIFRGLAWQEANEIDTQVIDEVRNMLFGPPGGGFGLDLLALNLQRGRDHGLADYNTIRAAMGLPAATDFSDITTDAALAAELQALYGDVDDIDLWIGLMAEDKAPGSGVSETLGAILIDQFERLRDGDRFFYLNDPNLTLADLMLIEDRTLGDILLDNTDISWLQGNVFTMGIPAPASVALLTGGGLLAARRRRR